MVIMGCEFCGAVEAALAPGSDEMLGSTPSLGQLVDSIHSGLDVDRLSMVYVGFSMKDAPQLCEDAAAEVTARTPGQVPADLQRGNTRFLDGHFNVQMQTLAFQARVRTRPETTPAPALLSGPSGDEESSSVEYKHDCNRKSCGVPVAIDNTDHASSSAIKFEETVLCVCRSGYILDVTLDENKSSTTTCGVAANGSMVWSPTPGSSALNTCMKVVFFHDVVKYSCEEGHTATGLDGVSSHGEGRPHDEATLWNHHAGQ